jgi:fermentation-respiration switch protein FrsA (DUF1100 family)
VDKKRIKKLLVGDFTLKRLVRSLILIPVLVYVGIFFYGLFYADTMIFCPPPASYRDNEKIIKLKSGDSYISAVFLPAPNARFTILFSHGNAEDIGLNVEYSESLRRLGFSVLSYDYSGYGTSSGTPSEENTYRDVDAAYDYLVNDLQIAPQQIIAFGRSLGGAVAVDLASRREIGGLIVESSFVTAYRVMTRVALFPIDKFKSISKMSQIRCPVLVIHGTKDKTIPLWHGEKLFEEASTPKLPLWVDGAGHNNLLYIAGSRYGKTLHDFAQIIESQN